MIKRKYHLHVHVDKTNNDSTEIEFFFSAFSKLTKCNGRLARKCTEEVNGITEFVSMITAGAINLVCNYIHVDSDKCHRFMASKKPKEVIRPKSFMSDM